MKSLSSRGFSSGRRKWNSEEARAIRADVLPAGASTVEALYRWPEHAIDSLNDEEIS